MVKHKPASGPSWADIHPWLDRSWPNGVLCRVVLWPERVRGGWYPFVELANVTQSGFVLPARRFAEHGALRRDEHIMGSLFRAAIACSNWCDEQGDELARRVAWEAIADHHNV